MNKKIGIIKGTCILCNKKNWTNNILLSKYWIHVKCWVLYEQFKLLIKNT